MCSFGGYLRKECGHSAAAGLKRTEKFFFLSLPRTRTWSPCLDTHEVTESLGKRRLPDPTSGMMLFNDLTPLNLFSQLPRSTMEFYLHSSALSTSTSVTAHAPLGDVLNQVVTTCIHNKFIAVFSYCSHLFKKAEYLLFYLLRYVSCIQHKVAVAK